MFVMTGIGYWLNMFVEFSSCPRRNVSCLPARRGPVKFLVGMFPKDCCFRPAHA